MMKSLAQVVVGLLVLVVFVYVLMVRSWLMAAVTLVKGGVVVVLFFLGVGLVLLGLSGLKG